MGELNERITIPRGIEGNIRVGHNLPAVTGANKLDAAQRWVGFKIDPAIGANDVKGNGINFDLAAGGMNQQGGNLVVSKNSFVKGLLVALNLPTLRLRPSSDIVNQALILKGEDGVISISDDK